MNARLLTETLSGEMTILCTQFFRLKIFISPLHDGCVYKNAQQHPYRIVAVAVTMVGAMPRQEKKCNFISSARLCVMCVCVRA